MLQILNHHNCKNLAFPIFVLVIILSGCRDPVGPIEQKQPSDDFSIFARIAADDYKKNSEFMGNVAVVKDGQVIFKWSTGYADISNQQINNEYTLFRIGSISKTYTAALIFKAIEAGELSLDTTLDRFLPDFPEAKRITVAHLLQHRSGIYNFVKDRKLSRRIFSSGTTHKEMIAAFSTYEPVFEPGTSAEYSNSAYYLLGYILEKINQQSYSKILNQQLAQPLDLDNTFHPVEVKNSNYEALSYKFENGWIELPTTHPSATYGGGSLVTTTVELAKFMHYLLSGSLVEPESLAYMKKQTAGYGMGLMNMSVGGQQGYGHGGSIDGFESIAVHFPKGNLTIAITGNGTTDPLNALVAALVKAYFGEETQPISVEEAAIYAGTYNDTEASSEPLVFIAKDGGLVLLILNEFEEPLDYKGNGKFLFEQLHAPAMTFVFSKDGKTVTQIQGNYDGLFERNLTQN